MKIEHITHSLPVNYFHTSGLDMSVYPHFHEIEEIEESLTNIQCPLLKDFQIELTIEKNYAIFYIEKAGKPVLFNYACFSNNGKKDVLKHIYKFTKALGINKETLIVPIEEMFLYTFIKDKKQASVLHEVILFEQYIFTTLLYRRNKSFVFSKVD